MKSNLNESVFLTRDSFEPRKRFSHSQMELDKPQINLKLANQATIQDFKLLIDTK